MMEQILRCYCGRPYRVYSHYCGDQSLCPGCRMDMEAEVQRWEKSGYSQGRAPLPPRRQIPRRREDGMTLMVSMKV